MDSLILEVLKERVGSLSVVDIEDIVKFGDDEITNRSDKRYATSFAQRSPPPNKFTVKDIKQLLISLRLSYPKSRSEVKWQLQKAKEVIEERGTDEEKIQWHIALSLLQKNYNLARKIQVPNPLETYSTLDRPIPAAKFREYAKKGTWIGLSVDPEPAQSADNIDVAELSSQEVGSLFRTDIRNSGGETGVFPADVTNAINTLFVNTKNLFQRIELISNFSEALSEILEGDRNPVDIDVKEMQAYIAQAVLLDYFTSIVSDMDDGAGAYMFETFLAALAGGKVEGKKKTATGQMAATDFEFGGGEQGSAKYYSSPDNIGQAVGGFDANVPMHYIVGIKNKQVSGEESIIKSVDIYYYKIILVPMGRQPDGKLTNVRVYAFDPDGAPLSPNEKWTARGELKLNKSFLYSDSTKLGTIEILGASDKARKTFKDSMLEAIGRINKDFQEILSGLGAVAATADSVKEDSNRYAMDGISTSGDKAIQSMKSLNSFFGDLFNKLADMGYQKTIQDPTELNEKNEKNNLSALDKLIEHVILYKNTEEK